MSARGGGGAAENHRLFLASWPTDDHRAELAQVLPKIEWASGGRRVPVASYHLTLAFLGGVPSARLDAVRRAADQARASAFDLAFDRLEYWPKPRVLCLVASTLPGAAHTLVQELWRVLVRAGFTQDVRPFKAHLTLARKVERPPPDHAIAPIPWRVDRFALIESTSTTDGPLYTPLAFWPLTSSST
jgi:RNA 2',3'-cyclic 3'-phosphodiesterase